MVAAHANLESFGAHKKSCVVDGATTAKANCNQTAPRRAPRATKGGRVKSNATYLSVGARPLGCFGVERARDGFAMAAREDGATKLCPAVNSAPTQRCRHVDEPMIKRFRWFGVRNAGAFE